jgi:hypothetical protein
MFGPHWQVIIEVAQGRQTHQDGAAAALVFMLSLRN